MNGANIDGQWYLDVLGFVRATPWLHGPLTLYANYGLVLFGALVLLGCWLARQDTPAALAAALWAPVATLLALGVNLLLKLSFDEPRPCRSLPGVRTLAPCDAPTDWSFPSTHSAVAAAVAVAVLLTRRRLGAVAVLAALLMAFSRVYIGVHYPHDVIAGLVVGGLCGLTGLVAAPRLARVLPDRRVHALGVRRPS